MINPQNGILYKSFKKMGTFTVLLWKGSQEEITEQRQVAENYRE